MKKETPGVKREAAEVIDLDDDDDVVGVPVPQQAIAVKEPVVKKSKEDIKKEIKAEAVEKQRRKEKKAAKVKREKGGDDAPQKPKGGNEKDRGEDGGRKRDRSRSKKRKAAESSSSSSSSEESSMSDLYRKFKPYTKVCLRNLVRKADLNGMTGQVVHPSTSVCPCPPGCVLVRLETGREIGVKPANLAPLMAFHRGPQQAGLTQEARLKSVLTQIKLNMNTVSDTGVSEGPGSSAILDDPGAVQGGIGHML